MANRWFYSDLHLDHDNIIKFCNRPFSNGQEMTEFLIDTHNAYVKPEDRAYNLGDLTMHRGRKWIDWLNTTVRRMNGHKILYLGNHDHFEAKEYLNAGFEDIRATWRDQMGFVCSHFPIHPSSMGTATANMHGHTHDSADEAPVLTDGVIRPYINISIEKTDYRPINLDELLQRIRLAQEEYGKTTDIQDKI